MCMQAKLSYNVSTQFLPTSTKISLLIKVIPLQFVRTCKPWPWMSCPTFVLTLRVKFLKFVRHSPWVLVLMVLVQPLHLMWIHNMANPRGSVNPLEDHGLIDMHNFLRVIAQVDVLENSLYTFNTIFTIKYFFNHFIAHYALFVSRLVASGGPIPKVMRHLSLNPLIESAKPYKMQELAMLKTLKPPMQKGEEHNYKKDEFYTLFHKWMALHCL